MPGMPAQGTNLPDFMRPVKVDSWPAADDQPTERFHDRRAFADNPKQTCVERSNGFILLLR